MVILKGSRLGWLQEEPAVSAPGQAGVTVLVAGSLGKEGNREIGDDIGLKTLNNEREVF